MRSRFDDYPWPPFGRPRPAPFARPRPVEPVPTPTPTGRAPEARRPASTPPPASSASPTPAAPKGATTSPDERSTEPSADEAPRSNTAQRRPGASPGGAEVQRALDDLAAAEARVERNAQRVYDESRAKLAADLLPVLDNLDRTLQAAKADDPIATGVSMVRAQLEGVLARYGVERIDAVGKAFDPSEHEAVVGIPVEDEAVVGRVMEQVAPGYRLAGRLLRPARVQVGVKVDAAE